MRSRKVALHAALLSLPLLAAHRILRAAQAWPAGVGSVEPPPLDTSKPSSRRTPRARAKALKLGFMSESIETATHSIPRQPCVSPFGIAPPSRILWRLVCGDSCLPHPRPSHKTPCRPHSLSFLSIRLQTYQSTSTKPNNNPIPQI